MITDGRDIDKILEELHEKLVIGWVKNDGKAHVLQSHTNSLDRVYVFHPPISTPLKDSK